jgi:hypothetical protein
MSLAVLLCGCELLSLLSHHLTLHVTSPGLHMYGVGAPFQGRTTKAAGRHRHIVSVLLYFVQTMSISDPLSFSVHSFVNYSTLNHMLSTKFVIIEENAVSRLPLQ